MVVGVRQERARIARILEVNGHQAEVAVHIEAGDRQIRQAIAVQVADRRRTGDPRRERIGDRQAHPRQEGAGAGRILQQVGHLARVIRDDQVRQSIAIDVGHLHIVGVATHVDVDRLAVHSRGRRGFHE